MPEPFPTLRFPHDLLRLLYWVFFRPITLESYIRQMAPGTRRSTGILSLWRRGHQPGYQALGDLLRLAWFHLLLTPWLLGFALAGLLDLAGMEVNWLGVAGGVAGGVVLGVVFGVWYGVASGAAYGVGYGVAGGVWLGVTSGAAGGVALGVALGAALGVRGGVRVGVAGGVVFGVALSVVLGAAVGVSGGVMGGMAGGISCILCYFRLPLYLLQAPLSWLLARRAAPLALSPVYWDEVIWPPLPGLDQQLLALATRDRPAGLRAIAFTAASFRQGWAAQRALVELAAGDVERAGNLPGVAAIGETLAWLPPKLAPELEALLPPLAEIAARARAALESETLYNRQEQLRAAQAQAQAVRQGLGGLADRRLANRFGAALAGWGALFEAELAALAQQERIPNVYVAGSPLAQDSRAFKGRRDLFRALEAELASPAGQRPAVLLYGSRRMGKTSALRQLPSRLGPQIVPVMVDLQEAATAQDAAGLLYLLASGVRQGAAACRHLALPELPRQALQDDPYLAFQDWLRPVEAALEQRWVLLALDEFEALGEMLAAGRLDERIFSLLRALIQHHPRFTLLLSGAHTLEDLPSLWSHYLINVRLLKIGPLQPAEARELVERPIADFPLRYAPGAAERLLALTGCQPLLLQAACRDLVNALNERPAVEAQPGAAPTWLAELADVERALDSALVSAAGYFSDLWGGRDSDEAQRAVLSALASAPGEALDAPALAARLPDLPPAEISLALERLAHRDVLASDAAGYSFQAPLVRRWVLRRRG
ncbi:MAG: ATP-binding protein [Chloroflexota bacterium]